LANQPADPLQTLRQPGLGQPPTRLVLNLNVVVIFGPIVTDEQQHPAATPSEK
jgi:hypothetical protein